MIGDPPLFSCLQSVPLSLSAPSQRIMPVLVPMPDWSNELTVVTVDKNGNVHIYTEQPKPEC